MIQRGFDARFAVRVILALVVGLASGFLFHFERGYFPRIALLIGVSIGILTYVAIQTIGRLWRLWRPRGRDAE